MSRSLLFSTISILGIFVTSLGAAPGDLDLSFGDSGKVISSIGSYNTARAVIVDELARTLVGGEAFVGSGYRFAIERYLSDGTPDPTFGTGGTVTTDVGGGRGIWGMALQSDGKIVAVGEANNGTTNVLAVVRYNSDGNLDPSFSGDGILMIPLSGISMAVDVAIQPNGMIIVAGLGSSNTFALVRLTEFGVLDPSFSGDGIVTGTGISLRTAVLQSDGMTVVAGMSSARQFTLMRYTAEGVPDLTFSGDGRVETVFEQGESSIADLQIQDDGKIVAVGVVDDEETGNDNLTVARYRADGTLDSNFADGGIFNIADNAQPLGMGSSQGRSVLVAADGKIVVGGYAESSGPARNLLYNFAFIRLDGDGALDPTFGDDGLLVHTLTDQNHFIEGMTFQRDGKIVAVGIWPYLFQLNPQQQTTRTNFATVRIEGDLDTDFDGLPDYAETDSGIYIGPNDTGTDPNDPDTDGDGLADGLEVRELKSNPLLTDTDSDGFDDFFEVSTGFDPTLATSTPQAYSEILTAVEFRFNAADGVSYKIETSINLENWEVIETGIIGTGARVTRFYSVEGTTRHFYRARRE